VKRKRSPVTVREDRDPDATVDTARAVAAALKQAERGALCRCPHHQEREPMRRLADPSWWFVCVRYPGLGQRRAWGPRFHVLARSAEEARVKVWPRLRALDKGRILAWRYELSITPAYGSALDCTVLR
jgi:hypothetical protein